MTPGRFARLLPLLVLSAVFGCGDDGPSSPSVGSNPPLFLFALGSSNAGAFRSPQSIAADPDGNVYVYDGDAYQVQKMDRDGRHRYFLDIPNLGHRYYVYDQFLVSAFPALVTQGGRVYVTNPPQGEISCFDGNDGHFLFKWGRRGAGDGEFENLIDIAADSSGHIFTVDTSYRVQKFTSDGRFLAAWGSRGTHPGEFEASSSLAVDPAGVLYVADAALDRIQKFDLDGAFLGMWGVTAQHSDSPLPPRSIGVDRESNIVILSSITLQKRAPDGTLLEQTQIDYPRPDGEFDPVDFAIDVSGDLLILDRGLRAIQKITPAGAIVATLGHAYGEGTGEFEPSDMAVDFKGNLFVTDYRGRLHRFSGAGAALGDVDLLESGLESVPSLVVGWNGHLHVVDYYRNAVVELSPEGRRIGAWSLPGAEVHISAFVPVGFDRIAFYRGGELQVFTLDGAPLVSFPILEPGERAAVASIAARPGGFDVLIEKYFPPDPHEASPFGHYVPLVRRFSDSGTRGGDIRLTDDAESVELSGGDMVVDEDGNWIVVDYGRILRFGRDGRRVADWDDWDTGQGRLESPNRILLDGYGSLFILDGGRNQVLKFDTRERRP